MPNTEVPGTLDTVADMIAGIVADITKTCFNELQTVPDMLETHTKELDRIKTNIEQDPENASQYQQELEAAFHTLELKRNSLQAAVKEAKEQQGSPGTGSDGPQRKPQARPPAESTSKTTATQGDASSSQSGGPIKGAFAKQTTRAPSPARSLAAPYHTEQTPENPFGGLT